MSRVMQAEVFKVTGTIKKESDKAILIIPDESMELEGTEHQKGIWFPFSQVKEIHKGSVMGDGVGNDSLIVSQWIATQKGLV